MSQVLATVGANTVEITERQARIYAKRFGMEYVDSNVPGVLESLSGWIDGKGDADSFLFESPETRVEFANIRTAYDMVTTGVVKPEDQFSNVSITEVIPDWVEFSATLPV